jgi:dTDP-L-rhamnose 4-epimerase
MKVLVTGGAGFIGSHIVDALAETGHRVLVIDSLDPAIYKAPPPYLRSDVDYSFIDLRHWQPTSAFDDVEAVVHLAALGGVSRAAREPANVLSANVAGTARLVEACARWPKLQRFVLASSFSVYGANYKYRLPSTGETRDGSRAIADLDAGRFDVRDRKSGEVAEIVPITENATPNPLELYGASKYMQELCLRGFTHAPVTIFRFSSVYGTRLRLDDGEATIVAKLAGWIRDGHEPTLFEDGRQLRDWVYVGDLVEAVTRVVEGAAAPPIVNVCSGVGTSLIDACEHIGRVFGVNATYRVVGGYRAGDMRHCLGDQSSLAKLIGRAPLTFAEGAPLAFGSVSEMVSEVVSDTVGGR